MALAGLFLGGTCFVLFQDIIQGAQLSTSHVLTMLALVAATAAGHACVPVGREHRYVLALGLAVVALGGLGYIVTMSGARNAETIAKKAGAVHQNNADRAKLEAVRNDRCCLFLCPRAPRAVPSAQWRRARGPLFLRLPLPCSRRRRPLEPRQAMARN